MTRPRIWLAISSVAGVICTIAAVVFVRERRRHHHTGVAGGSWLWRQARLARLGVRVGGNYAGTAARKTFVSTARREELDRQREFRTAAQVADQLGQMKGALMKLGQMASYLDDGLPEPLRLALGELRTDAPPMSVELAVRTVEEELGGPLEQHFVEFDPEPIAAASIGQVHRAIARDVRTGEERAVAVKVQYPGVAEAMVSDLRSADLLGSLLQLGFGGLDPTEMVDEVKVRLTEEVDYANEALNQQRFVDFYNGHPFIHVPDVLHELSTKRILTTELVSGDSWDDVLSCDQAERDRAGEIIFRFVFRSLYRMRAFNGDPHPGNYIFRPDGKISFIDFGLVKHFSDDEMSLFENMVRAAAVDHDTERFHELLVGGGMLSKHADVGTDDVSEYFSHFYAAVSQDREMTWTRDYANSIVRHTFDRSSPISQYATVPRSFVFIQRINLGLYALLGELGATGNYRRISAEIWPFVEGPPSTELGAAEAEWARRRSATADR